MDKEKRLTPSQRREARKLAGVQAAQDKRARLLERPLEEQTHTPRINTVPELSKTARSIQNPTSIYSLPMEWCPLRSDREGSWSWGQERAWAEDEWTATIEPALVELAKLTWSEIVAQMTGGKNRHKKHHDMDVGVIADEALTRWIEHGLEEYDTAFRFRLGNKPRLWGFRTGAKFNIVWWDPNHMIYPVDIANN